MIFIGILFTTVIPMMLVMKQADTIYTQKVHEMEVMDQECAKEDVKVYSYPVDEHGTDVKVSVENTGVVPIKVVRVWINDDNYSQSTTIAASETKILGPFSVELVEGTSYKIKIATERGNNFYSHSGSLYYSDGTWFASSLGICVYILNSGGKYKITVTNGTWSENYTSSGTEHDDIIVTFEVVTPTNYYITVKKKVGGSYVCLPNMPYAVVFQWPDGPPIIYVIVNGDEL